MEEFFSIINPTVQYIIDNLHFIILTLILFCNKNTRYFGMTMAIGFICWGFQTWIAVVCYILAILFGGIKISYKTYKDNKKDE